MSVITTDRGGRWTGDAGLSHFDGSLNPLKPGALLYPCYNIPSEEGKWGASRQIWTPFFPGWTPRLQWVHYVVLLKRGQPGELCGGR